MTTTDAPTIRAVRLVVAVQDGLLSLLSQTPVEVWTPPLDTAVAPAPGGYLELHDDAGNAMGRLHVGADFTSGLEVVPEEPGGSPSALPVRATDAFTVVVPVVDGAVDIVAVRVGPPPGDTAAGPADEPSFSAAPAAGQVTEVARFRLDAGQA